MSYFAEWFIIINSVIATLTIGYLLNRFALRKTAVKARVLSAEAQLPRLRR